MDFDDLFPSTIPLNSLAVGSSGPRVLAYDPGTNQAQFYLLAQLLAGGIGGASASVTAGTTQTQAGATPLTAVINVVSTNATAGNGVALPASAAGNFAIVVNATSKAIQVYGASPDTINGVATATGVPQQAMTIALYVCAAAGAWWAERGVGLGLPSYTTANALTALAGGGQSGATLLSAALNRVTTVATDHDSAILPASSPGNVVAVFNKGAHILDVYANGTEVINAIAASSPISLAAAKSAFFVCSVAGTWDTIPTVPS